MGSSHRNVACMSIDLFPSFLMEGGGGGVKGISTKSAHKNVQKTYAKGHAYFTPMAAGRSNLCFRFLSQD